MKISDMISQLQLLQGDIGDVEVFISDDWVENFYQGNYRIKRHFNNGEVVAEINIGGCDIMERS